MTTVESSPRDDLKEIARAIRKGRRSPEEPPRPRSRRRRLIALAVVLVLAASAVWIVVFSPILAVSKVTVRGVHRLSAATVVDHAAVPHGVPLVRIPRAAITRRVEALPDVLSASVSVSFPSTVVITVRERTASGTVQLGASSWGLVDGTGRRFSTVASKPVGLPLLAPAAAVAGDPATLAAMAGVAVSVPSSVRTVLSQVTATGPRDVRLVLADGRIVVWGASERNADKARTLLALLAQPGHTFNVVNPDLPYTRAN